MGADFHPEVFGRRLGRLTQIDSTSDADTILSNLDKDGQRMRFRLIYQGDLKSAGNNNSRSKEKWQIRAAISPQLEELWQKHPMLNSNIALTEDSEYSPQGFLTKLTPEAQREKERQLAIKRRTPIDVGGQSFLPLVKKAWSVTCGLDILFLRKDSQQSVISNRGDLDNRLKLLFDGLRTRFIMPDGGLLVG